MGLADRMSSIKIIRLLALLVLLSQVLLVAGVVIPLSLKQVSVIVTTSHSTFYTEVVEYTDLSTTVIKTLTIPVTANATQNSAS